MKKIIAIFILLVIFAPFWVLANSGDAAIPPIYSNVSIFDELRSFSAKINSFLIPNYSGNPYGLLAEIKNKFLEAVPIAKQWFSDAALEIKSKSQYAIDSLLKLKNYIFEKRPAEDAVNAVKNAINEKLRVFPSP